MLQVVNRLVASTSWMSKALQQVWLKDLLQLDKIDKFVANIVDKLQQAGKSDL